MLRKYILGTIFLVASLSAFGQSNVEWSVTTKQVKDNVFEIVFTATIEQPWHLYDLGPYNDGPIPTSIKVKADSGAVVQGEVYMISKPKRVMDEVFGMEIGYFEQKALFGQKVMMTAEKATLTAVAEWMVCNETNCMPPNDAQFDISISHPTFVGAAAEPSPLKKNEKNSWGFIIEAILWGLAALLTPCVFPMIPMTISYFLKNQDNPAKGRLMASLYGLFIVALYTLPIVVLIATTKLVGGDASTIGFFNWLSTHWLPNILFFTVFMLFAASFFGAFEITLPSKIVNKSDKKADRGGVVGTFFMALTLVLVSFSCTGPIVGTVLIKSTQGEIWTPVFAILAFSLTFAMPFTIFAIFPSLLGRLKSGSWLNSVKVVLGFVEVALGLKFLSIADQTYHWGLLDREIYLAIWIVVFSLLGLYLLGKINFKHDNPTKHLTVTRLFFSIATFSFVVYLVPGMFGAPLKGLSGYLPPISSQDFVLGQPSGVATNVKNDSLQVKYGEILHLPHGLEGFFELTQAQEYARTVNKPLLIDFTGHGCVNCREMEARVWSDSRVLELLRNQFVIVALYTDDKLTAYPNDWITTDSGKVLKQIGKINTFIANTKYGVGAQPYYIITDTLGNTVADHQYDLNVDNFIRFLEKGVNEYKTE